MIADILNQLAPAIAATVVAVLGGMATFALNSLKNKWNIDVSQQTRDSLHAALDTSVRAAIIDALGQLKPGETLEHISLPVVLNNASNVVKSTNPGQIKKFNIDNRTLNDLLTSKVPGVLAQMGLTALTAVSATNPIVAMAMPVAKNTLGKLILKG